MTAFCGLPTTASLNSKGDALSKVRDTCRSETVGWSRCRFSWPEPTSTVVLRPTLNDAESQASQPSCFVSVTSPLSVPYDM
jgi:hypothetical protein